VRRGQTHPTDTCRMAIQFSPAAPRQDFGDGRSRCARHSARNQAFPNRKGQQSPARPQPPAAGVDPNTRGGFREGKSLEDGGRSVEDEDWKFHSSGPNALRSRMRLTVRKAVPADWRTIQQLDD